jgi:hypothetical protein
MGHNSFFLSWGIYSYFSKVVTLIAAPVTPLLDLLKKEQVPYKRAMKAVTLDSLIFLKRKIKHVTTFLNLGAKTPRSKRKG